MPKSTTPETSPQSIPHGFIAAVALTSGDVLGVSYDGSVLSIRWADSHTDEMIPHEFNVQDLPRVAQLIADARALFESEG